MACDLPLRCRICAQKNRTLISIYSEEGIFRQLITKLKYCLQIIVLENDDLPTTICWKCLSKLETCFELMQELAKGQNEFRKLKMINQSWPLTLDKSEVKMENKAENFTMAENVETSISNDSNILHNSPRTPEYHYPNRSQECDCEECRYKNTQSKVEETTDSEIRTHSEEQNAMSQPSHHSSVCNCEHCVNQYGALPLLADVIHRNDDASSSGSSYSKTTEHSNSFSETHTNFQHGSGDSGGPIRVSIKKKINCEFCGKLFSHTGDLNKHRRRHTGERPYPCSECSKRFSHASNLLRHQKIHSGEMPHECPMCKKRFSRKDKMVNHLKNTHKSNTSSQS